MTLKRKLGIVAAVLVVLLGAAVLLLSSSNDDDNQPLIRAEFLRYENAGNTAVIQIMNPSSVTVSGICKGAVDRVEFILGPKRKHQWSVPMALIVPADELDTPLVNVLFRRRRGALYYPAIELLNKLGITAETQRIYQVDLYLPRLPKSPLP